VLIVLIVLYIGSQLLSSVLTPSTGDRNQRLIMYGLPFVFTFIIIRFPAGLIVYWITTNLWTVGQGYILRKKMGPISPPKLEPAAAGGGADGGGGGVGGFFARLTGGAPAARPAPSPSPSASPSPSSDSDGATSSKSRPRTTPSGPPPRPPRKKKKRSGRRR
jgi:YidC/Oxa1 family membrane protein insertase